MKENLVSHWQVKDYSDFRKCGGILVSADNEMTTFGLNCRFCPVVCMQFDIFVRHMREQHSRDIRTLQPEDDAKEQCTQHTQTDTADCCWRCVSVGTNGAGLGGVGAGAAVGAGAVAADNEIDSDFDWNEITAMLNEDGIIMTSPAPSPTPSLAVDLMATITSGTATTAVPLSTGAASAPTEAVSLVYIVEESQRPGEILMEEETVDSYEIFRGGSSTADRSLERVSDEASKQAYDENDMINDDDEENSYSSQKSNDSPQSVASPSPSSNSSGHSHRESKDKYKKTPAMRAVTKNKEIISYIIGAYRANEKFWNPNHPEYKYNANRQMYNELAGPLERDMKCFLSGTEIFGIITELRGRYRRELTKTKERKGAYKTKLWYFEKMEFLRNLIEDKRAVRQAKHLESDATECKLLERREIQSYLLDAYKSREVLWNPHHLEFQHCNSQQQYDDIALCLQENLNVDLSGTECHNEIKRLRTCYRKELGFMAKRKGLHVPKLWCFDQMEFLKPVLDEEMNKRENKLTSESRSRMKFLKADAIPLHTTDEYLRFIEIYKGYTSLWDVEHPDFRASSYRTKSLTQMLEQINCELHGQYNVDQLEKTLYQLRKEYSAEKEKLLTGNESAPVMPAELYEKLREFLDTNMGPFWCDLCQLLLKTSDQYKIHRSGHDGSKPFKCTLCGKGFQIPGNLTIHIRRHKRDYPYACELCDKRFPTTSELTIHMRSHTGERPYICDLCGKSFKTWSFFDIHRRAHLNQSPFHCPICDKGFYERNRFTDHMNIHLNIRKHSCTECGKSFTTFANLRKHSELHLPVKKYNCNDCQRGFSQFASLRWHMRTAHKDLNALSGTRRGQKDSTGDDDAERMEYSNSIEH